MKHKNAQAFTMFGPIIAPVIRARSENGKTEVDRTYDRLFVCGGFADIHRGITALLSCESLTSKKNDANKMHQDNSQEVNTKTISLLL